MIARKTFNEDYFHKGTYGRQSFLIIRRNYRLLLETAKTINPLPKKLDLILDFGCAFGIGTKFLVDEFPRVKVVGVDISNYAIEKAKSNPTWENITYYCLDISNAKSVDFLQKKYGNFDLIFTRDTLEHITFQKQEKIIRSFSKLLEKNGLLMVQTPNKLNVFSRLDSTHTGLRTPNSWRKLFEKFFEHVDMLVKQYSPILWRFRKNKEINEFKLPILGYNIYIFCRTGKDYR